VSNVNALSLTNSVHDWLAKTRQARILHVFDRACNLINEHGEVLSIVGPHIEAGPFNLVIATEVSFSAYIDVRSPVSIRTDRLQLGNLTISITGAHIWSPRPDWESLHAKRAAIAADGLQSCLSAWKSNSFESSLGLELFPGKEVAAAAPRESILPVGLTSERFPAVQSSLTNSFRSALASADLAACLNAAQKLAGLGPGLTPAGDDYILGGVLAAWIIHPPEIARALANRVTNVAAPLTGSLSGAWLRSAGRGEAGIVWHVFFEALVSSDPARIQAAMDSILAVGATSGADALAGFTSTWMGWVELASSKFP
jgi:hypothetical protein